MAVYIEDEETCNLISRYAELKHSSKTGALRDLLRREIQGLERKASAEERYRKLMSWLGPAPEVPPEPIPKEYYDWLAGESELPALSPALKKELGVND
ncbi:MAG: type II toxin-antitoxin system VapB family antitoxin [Acidobacteriaceae bacterium]|nr:type II toxin-antitoxin system VapB family antitoxin [Acidobacteriaceae bacterium]